MKCNRPDVVPSGVVVRVTWVPMWVWLLLPLGLLPYAIGRVATRRRGVARIHLCAAHHRQRTVLRLGTPLALALVTIGSMGLASVTDEPSWLLVSLCGLVSLFVLPVGTVWPWRIRGAWLELGGASAAFRHSLPVWGDAEQTRFDLDELADIDP